MNSQTKKVLALVALIVATGVAVVELTRNPAQADSLLVQGGAAGYAGSRIDGAFQLAANVPASEFEFPVAEKGDLLVPAGCIGPFRADVQAECMDVAYELESEHEGMIVEERTDDTSILTRMVEYTLAGF